MVVKISIGRRVPRQWFKRQIHKAKGLLSFQENIWLIIDRSMSLAKRKATQSSVKIDFQKSGHREPEDLNWDLEWIEVQIRSPDKNLEEEEYQEAMGMYKTLKTLFKSEFPENEDLKRSFITKRLSESQLKKAYKAGYGAAGDNTIAQKLLDMGIITLIEKIDD